MAYDWRLECLFGCFEERHVFGIGGKATVEQIFSEEDDVGQP
jgi:hypothetical protein